METREVFSTEKATVVIQVNPQVPHESIIFVDGQKKHHNTALEGYFRAQPKALGTVQIMIGVMVFSLGVLLTTEVNSFHHPPAPRLVFSGITYWGSLIYISAGSLSVAAQNKRNVCMVKASLGMNVFSAVTAGISSLLMGIDIFMILDFPPDVNAEVLRIVVIMLVFTVPQLFISICISAFVCKATCNSSSVVSVTLDQGY